MLGVGLVTFTWISNFFLSHLEDSLFAQLSLLSNEWIYLLLPPFKNAYKSTMEGSALPRETREHVMIDFS